MLILKAVGLRSDPYNLLMNQWCVDVDMLPRIRFLDISMYLISTLGKYTKESLKAYELLVGACVLLPGMFLTYI